MRGIIKASYLDF